MQTTDGCIVCRNMWWDSEGICRPYTEKDIGAREWIHRGSTVLSIIWVLILFGFTLYEMTLRIKYLGGQKKELVPFINFATHNIFNMSIPAFVLLANVRHLRMDRRRLRRVEGFRWWKALSIRFIVRRLQHLEMRNRRMPHKAFLIICLVWPLFNGMYSLILFVTRLKSSEETVVSLVFSVLCMIVWGVFCYLVLLLRLSFLQQQRLELGFLWRHAGKLDVCRRQLSMYVEDLGCLRQLVSGWIIVVVAVSSWAFSSMLYWEYVVISSRLKVKRDYFFEFNFNLWSTNIMFLSLPLLAVGGMELKGMWSRFKYSISQMRSESHDAFWDKILAYCEERSPTTRVKMLALMVSALGLFVGLHLSVEDQDVNMPIQNELFTLFYHINSSSS
ncbi:uncharacterized protein LOC110980272 [Acanthaster planci]|uniref:Uncharacterized protein LOC110980272 n=1 Tax=Acanthaster planci TaxID=133434 RepID=A0A8B7YJC2_ACAPL|nr:uncharacterized protein LOC110980272 [Acanthaster planci]